jgi:hypothetical protein
MQYRFKSTKFKFEAKLTKRFVKRLVYWNKMSANLQFVLLIKIFRFKKLIQVIIIILNLKITLKFNGNLKKVKLTQTFSDKLIIGELEHRRDFEKTFFEINLLNLFRKNEDCSCHALSRKRGKLDAEKTRL